MKKNSGTPKNGGSSGGHGTGKKPESKSSSGIRKQLTKLPTGRKGGKQSALKPYDKYHAAARALLSGSGISTGGLSALLDQAVDELHDKNIKVGSGAAAATGAGPGGGSAQGASPMGAEASPRQPHPPSAPPPTPAGKVELPGAKPNRREVCDAGSVLGSLSAWGL
jgi:hypothetical protein